MCARREATRRTVQSILQGADARQRSLHFAVALVFPLFCALGSLSGCVRVRVTEDLQAKEELSCAVAGRTRVECRRKGLVVGGSIKTSLRGGPAGLRQHGVVQAGRYVCTVSDARGLDCRNVFFWTRFQSGPVERLRDRAFVSWDDGLCVETHRDQAFSRFECIQGGSIEERVDFWVPTRHERVGFGRGACICGSDPESLVVSQEQGVRGHVGAVCVWGWGEEPIDWETSRKVEQRATVLSVRGGFASFDFGDVCQVAREGTGTEVVEALSGLTTTDASDG